MYDHERSLVKKFQNKPFVLLGVNADDPTRLKEVIKEKDLNWDSWADGQGGPIAQEWKIRGFPTIFLIDHKGIIRVKNHGSPDLEETISAMVSEAEHQ